MLDIYATSIDYDPKAEMSQGFFKVVQNKVHWASHGHTAAEIIAERVDARQPNMGMTNWPGDSIRKMDVGIAKNYLRPQELEVLFLKMTGREILTHAGTVGHQKALEKARQEYDKHQQGILNEASPVERHFIQAVEEVKQIEDRRKRLDTEGEE